MVSIIVIAYNEEEMIGACLDAVLHEAQGVTFATEVIVVDNASCDKTREIASGYPVTCVVEYQRGISFSRNKGLQESCGDILVYIDGDCVPQQGWLKNTVEAFRDPQVTAVGMQAAHISQDRSIEALYAYTQNAITHTHRAGHVFVSLAGNSMAFRKDILESIHGFEAKLAGVEDVDAFWRLIMGGHKIRFLENTLVYHHTHARISEFVPAFFRQRMQTVKLYRAWKPVLDRYQQGLVFHLGYTLQQMRQFFSGTYFCRLRLREKYSVSILIITGILLFIPGMVCHAISYVATRRIPMIRF